MKETNFKTTKYNKQNTKQNKTKQNHKVKFSTSQKTHMVRVEANLHYFSMTSEN